MDARSMRWRGAESIARDWTWGALWNCLLCFGLVVFLGLEGGGYDPLVHDQVGIVVWWIVLVSVIAGALPRARLSPLAIAALLLFAAFAVWIALSLTWTESLDRTLIDLARATTFVGVFMLGLLSRDVGETQRTIGAVAAGIAVVVGVGLLSRLHPTLFGGALETGRILGSEDRLSFPLNYWNALAALAAIGLPLFLQLATGAKTIAVRALSAAALPALMLTLYFTISRGGIAAAAIGVAIFIVLAADRLPKLPVLAVAAAGGAVLVALAHSREDLRHGLTNATAHHQGDEMLILCLLVFAAVGLVVAGMTALSRRTERPRWTRPSALASGTILGVVVVALLFVAVAGDASGRASDAWTEFKSEGGPGEGTGRLGSAAGESRYQFWSAAVDENGTAPLKGTGSGTFQFWWAREGDGSETVRDAHSLYLQTLGEVGIVGLALLAAFILTVLAGGVRAALLSPGAERSRLAAALAGCSVFFMTAAVDWMWQVPVLPVTMLLLAACLFPPVREPDPERRLPLIGRVAIAVAAVVAIAVIAMPLASLSLVRKSQAQAREGDLPAALESARSAQNVEPGAAGPRLQQALVLELQGDLGAAEAAARAAAEREPTNWRNLLVVSRLAAERGRADAAVRAYEEARALNPHGSIFRR
jgi:hypothetical protein